VIGRAKRTTEPRARGRFLARHPKAKLYADFADFSFWRLEIAGAHLNGGFARAMALEAGHVRSDLSDADALIAAEAGAVAHLNDDHRDALALYATALAGMPPGDWRATGLDPEGVDLAAGDLTARVPFPERIVEPGRLRAVLKALADNARKNA
jgi:heme iron utilization protein